MNNLKPLRLTELKLKAAFLLKGLRSSPADPSLIQRFIQVPRFSDKTVRWLIGHRDLIKLKDAYSVLAIEHGCNSWTELKQAVVEKDCLYRQCCIMYIHSWFNSYEPAKAYWKKHGGYLLSFWNDYVVCGPEYISCLELHVYSEYWERTGYNWIEPLDKKAWQLLQAKAVTIYLSKQ